MVGATRTSPATRASTSIWFIDNAQKAEAAKFDLVFIVDSPYITPDSAPHFLNRLEPLTLLSAVAAATKRIGLVATLTTSYTEPFNVARQFGSLDLISRGRAGWNVVTDRPRGRRWQLRSGRAHRPFGALRRAAEHVAVVQGLWDSKTMPSRATNSAAYSWTRASCTRCITVASSSPFAARSTSPVHARVSRSSFKRAPRKKGVISRLASPTAFTPTKRASKKRKTTTGTSSSAPWAYGRDPNEVLIFPGLVPILADTDELARKREQEINGQLDLKKALIQLGRPFNYHDFTQYPLDQPFPELGDLGLNGYRGGG